MSTNGANNFRWEYLIKPDKSATQQFEDLCVGLAKCIVGAPRCSDTSRPNHSPPLQIENEDGVGSELTPQRLAAFYRRVGGNYDTLFLKSGDHGLSFTYRTFGCFHSLQPTASPFEMPSVPCLTSHGFARWQTLQLLLTPEESIKFMQKAVELYRIPRKDGGFFPSRIPRECFPSEPDEAMEKWYTHVTGNLNQDSYMRRLKASPYQSPYPEERKDGYFQNGQSRNSSSEDHQARLDAYRRRSSVPEAVLPVPVPVSGDRSSHWDHHNRQPRKARSHSAQRPVQSPRQRAHTTSTPDKNPRHPSHHNGRPPSAQWNSHRHRISDGRSPHSRNNSASDASSENSHLDQKSRQRRDDSPKRRKSSLWPPSFFKSHRRRHSSDAGTQKIEAPPAKPPIPIPLRPEYYHRKQPTPMTQAPYSSAMPVYPPPPQRSQNGVRFRDHIFDDPNHSAPESPVVPPSIRYPEPRSVPQQMDPSAQSASRDSSSGSDRRHHSDWDRGQQRAAGFPSRINTVSGVSGRRYVTAEMKSPDGLNHPSSRTRGSAPTPV